jgi:hypothetical protein
MTLMDESVWRGTIYSGGPLGGAANLEAFTALSLRDRYRWLPDDR